MEIIKMREGKLTKQFSDLYSMENFKSETKNPAKESLQFAKVYQSLSRQMD
jgi:hypothetical protein